MGEPKRKRGRPRELKMPEPILNAPKAIVRACMQGPPKRDWDYLEPGSEARVLRPNSGEPT